MKSLQPQSIIHFREFVFLENFTPNQFRNTGPLLQPCPVLKMTDRVTSPGGCETRVNPDDEDEFPSPSRNRQYNYHDQLAARTDNYLDYCPKPKEKKLESLVLAYLHMY